MDYHIEVVNASAFNKWQMSRHYLKRPIIKTKMLAHGVIMNNELVGGLLWVTPHFTKKNGLFGYPGLLDKWEVLVLGRFYLTDECNLIASQIMSESIGKGKHRGSHRRGWRIQEDWVKANPPINPDNPFVPRLLMSWSDECYGHKGIIYQASGWEYYDNTSSNGQRSIAGSSTNSGKKRLWILRLPENNRAYRMAVQPKQKQMAMF